MNPLIKRILLSTVVLVVFSSGYNTVFAQTPEEIPEVIVLTYDGPLTPVFVEQMDRSIEVATERRSEVIVLQLNTPGGSTDLMNRIVASIRNSPIPVVVYVSPRNAMAGSAGTIITLAGHAAAMAPETTIGAASPVGAQGEDIGDTMQSKLKEMLKADARALAQTRSDEAIQLAEDTIETAKAVTVDEALEVGLVDIKAANLQDLMDQLAGFPVKIGGETVELDTEDAVIFEITPTFIEDLLKTIVNPNLVFLLLAIGIQAILIELSNPGGWIAGFIGVSSLLLAVYGLGILPVNWFGLLFMVLAFVLFILEIKTPTLGALTVVGTITFIAGALILFNSVRIPGFPKVSIPLVIGTGLVTAASFLAIVAFAIRAQRSPIRTGEESLPGKIGLAVTDLAPSGQVHVEGELWSASVIDGGEQILQGARVEVVGVQGIHLIVRTVQ